MSSLKEKIFKDMKEAIKDRDRVKLSVTRLLLSEIHNEEIQKKGELTDEEIFAVLAKSTKKRREAIEQFQAGNREELVASEQAELEIVESYLPKPYSEADIRRFVEKAVRNLKAAGSKDFGKVMKEVMNQAKGRAPGQMVSQIVQAILNKNAK